MKRLIATLFASVCFFVGFGNPGGIRIFEGLSMHSNILGQDVKFSLYLPEGYDQGNKRYPVVYLLHGLGDDESSWLEYGQIAQYAERAIQEDAVTPMIFVMPEGYRTYYVNDYAGKFMYQDMFIRELVPYIDSHYRTIADSRHRATMGYSMGGFGALVLPLKYPGIFGACVPLSISIRTDQQYITEEAPEWDKQWGSLFGGVGKTGNERITEYYKQNCPFHMIEQEDAAKWKDLKIYIANGDDEQTLCRSNEELHILMRDHKIQHEFRVRDGAHTFQFWTSSLPDALRFLSDAFESKPYRGDIIEKLPRGDLKAEQMKNVAVNGLMSRAYLPKEYFYSTRFYPVLYLAGRFSEEQQNEISAVVDKEIMQNEACPMIIVFLPAGSAGRINDLIPAFESDLRIRKGFRFRALAAYQSEARDAEKEIGQKEKFCAILLSDAHIVKDSISNLLASSHPEDMKRTLIYIDAPENGKYYAGNGFAHILLRDKAVQHEYRVREGAGGFEWFMNGLPEMIDYTVKRFHR